MEYKVFECLPEAYENQVFDLLCEADNDFFPPLSARSSTTQNTLDDKQSNSNCLPYAYFEQIKNQLTVLAVENEKVAGFMSLIPDRALTLGDKVFTCHYLSTLIVSKAERGKGISRMMYEFLLSNFSDKSIVTRTWSENAGHLKLLEGFGFKLLYTVKDDRAKGVDTVYFGLLK